MRKLVGAGFGAKIYLYNDSIDAILILYVGFMMF